MDKALKQKIDDLIPRRWDADHSGNQTIKLVSFQGVAAEDLGD